MTIAFVLIQCGNMDVDEIIGELKKVKSVTEIQGVFGIYDIMIKIQATDTKNIDDIIYTQIKRIKKLKSTLTLIVSSPYGDYL
jgi:DNA-binding Lrp family transcriptional regulator